MLTSSALAGAVRGGRPNPLVAAAAVRDAAAAVALGVQLAKFADGDPSRAARARAAGSTPARCERTSAARCGGTRRRSRTSARASPRRFCGCRSRESRWSAAVSGRRRTRPPLESRPSARWITRASRDLDRSATAASPRIRDAAPWWLAGLGVGLGFLEDVVGAGSVADGGSIGLGGIALPPGAPAVVAPPPRAPPRTSVSPGTRGYRRGRAPAHRRHLTRWSARPWSRCRCPRSSRGWILRSQLLREGRPAAGREIGHACARLRPCAPRARRPDTATRSPPRWR